MDYFSILLIRNAKKQHKHRNEQLVYFHGIHTVFKFFRAWLICFQQSTDISIISANDLSARWSVISRLKCNLKFLNLLEDHKILNCKQQVADVQLEKIFLKNKDIEMKYNLKNVSFKNFKKKQKAKVQ